jgi:DNA replication protein DnaC
LGQPKKELINNFDLDIKELTQKKIDLLIGNHYPGNYLEIDYSCNLCKDYGYIENKEGGFDKCNCYKQLFIKYSYSNSNLDYIENAGFEKFDPLIFEDELDENKYKIPISPRQNILNIKKKSIEFIEMFETEKKYKGLFFVGPTGVGKTFLSHCIGAELMKMGRTVLYFTSPQLFKIINDYKTIQFDKKATDTNNYNYIMEAELLIIDDLGIEPVTASRYSELLTIMTTRASNDTKKPCKTILSTNLKFKEINEIYTERVASRILGDYVILKFAGDDLRLNK